MDSGGKFLIGVAATTLLAFAVHFATGDKYINSLENSAQAELAAQGFDDVKVTFNRSPLSRSATLSGDVPEQSQAKALETVAGIAGVSNVNWITDTTADKGAAEAQQSSEGAKQEAKSTEKSVTPAVSPPANPAIQAKIAQCQGGVDKIIESKKLNFRSGSAYVSPESNRILDEVAAALKPCGGLTIAVGGHTDNNGVARVNKTMSQERADRVRQGLIDRGVAANLITATGYGAEKPLAAGDGEAVDAQNRRIEFKIAASAGAGAKTSQGD